MEKNIRQAERFGFYPLARGLVLLALGFQLGGNVIMSIQITWHGHACFTLEKDGYRIAIDPYDPDMKGYRPLEISANEVYASHSHHDHNYFDAISLSIPDEASPFSMRMVESFHDDCGGSKRGANLIYLLEAEGKTFAHLGDLGHVLTEDQVRVIGTCDVVMVPVGGYYTIDAKQAMEVISQLQADIVIPMHYRFDGHGPDVITELEDFLKLADREVVRYPENSISIDNTTKPQIAVLTFVE